MNKRRFLILVACALPILVFSLAVGVAAQSGAGQSPVGDDDDPQDAPVAVIPDRYQPVEESVASSNGGTEVYFTPQDQSTSVTLIFLYNTSASDANVLLQTFQLNGSLYVSQTVSVPAGELVRISADAVAAIGGSWTDAIYINFTTASAYGRLTLPEGVKADAYVAWNGGLTYDPLAAVPTLNLRFSSDPAAVFMPTIANN